MKTPREVLLEQHRAANVRLDDIRRAAIKDLSNETTKEQNVVAWLLGCAQKLRRELVLPRPQAWAGVAAIWVLIFALKFSTHDASPAVAKKTSVSPEVFAELKQQRAFFGELAGLPQSPEVKPSKTISPRPRSARRPEFIPT